MKHKIRFIAIWLLLIAVAIGAFTLTVNITSDIVGMADENENVVIDLDEDPNEIQTTQEQSFWERYLKGRTETDTQTEFLKKNKSSTVEKTEEDSTKETTENVK